MKLSRKLSKDLLERFIPGFEKILDGTSANVWLNNENREFTTSEEWLAHDLLKALGMEGNCVRPSDEVLKLTINFCKAMLKNEKIQ